jgi:hypothetical protein
MADSLVVDQITATSARITSNATNTFGQTVYVYLLVRQGNFSGNSTALENSAYLVQTYTLNSGQNLTNAVFNLSNLTPNTTYSVQWSMSRQTPLNSLFVDRRRPLNPPAIFTTTVAAPEWITSTLPNGEVGQSYSVGLFAVGATSYSIVSGSLPSGLSFFSNGQISGTPTTAQTTSFTVRATNAGGSTDRNFSITITQDVTPAPAWIDNTLSGDLRVGIAYSDGVSATNSPTYSVSSGSLPSGLTLNSSTGAVTGTPTAQGSFTFTLRAQNAGGQVTQNFTLAVKPGGFRWNGSSWVRITTLKRWDGSSWVDVALVRRWDGSNWVNANL